MPAAAKRSWTISPATSSESPSPTADWNPSTAPPFDSGIRNVSLWTAVGGAVVTVEKPERFLRRLFQTACGNHQEEVAEGFLVRFPQLRQFPQRGAARPRDVFGGVVTAAGAPCRASVPDADRRL